MTAPTRRLRASATLPGLLIGLVVFAAAAPGQGLPDGPATEAQVLRGRHLVITHDCGACHGGGVNPAAEGWLAGDADPPPGIQPGELQLYPRNLTPDHETGLGGVSERQIFNALRYGLSPTETPDVEITSHVPGEGGFPDDPVYLGPGMPWMYWRYMPAEDLWAIAAYLKHGLKPVRNEIPARQSPPDHWAGVYAERDLGPPALPAFPTRHEAEPPADRRGEVLRGRQLVAEHACSGCHGNAVHPGKEGWLRGITSDDDAFQMGGAIGLGPFITRPRNLTPHNTTGMGRFSERQIFNSLRYGLRPGETPDVEITSHTPGEGNFPMSPKYLAPPMPWPAFRYLSDGDLWAIAAYLKHGVEPVEHRVADSEGPPDFWTGAYGQFLSPYPAPAFPTARERRPGGQ